MEKLTALLTQLGDHRNQLAYRDLRQLSDIGRDAQPTFTTTWQQMEPDRRQRIAQALVDMAEDNVELDFRDAFVGMLHDQHATVRRLAATGLWEDDRLATLRTLLPLLADDPDPDVQAAVALTLSRYAYRCSVEEISTGDAEVLRSALLETVTNLDRLAEVRRRALEGLGYFEGEDVLQAIAQAYASGQRALKESALAAMGHTLDARWLPILEAELQSKEPALRYEAARASGELAHQAEPLVSYILPLIEDDDSEVALAAIGALGQIGGGGARRTLERIARSNNPVLQEAAQEAITELDLDTDPLAL